MSPPLDLSDCSALAAFGLLLGIATGAIGYLLGRGRAGEHYQAGFRAGYGEARSWTNARVIRARIHSFHAGIRAGLRRFRRNHR